ncbi:uncharacterized protein FIBRA_03148 [Fibroporia radiculosa]|uniref:Ricin B lectin domain-containing protein n=1 Tax=Fibroporia radiculosa TaxID=599839 RepID=J4GNB5_9APHY|nr:uncharacterized protein FIBRA_03148 [Fibroporia radiculosa]CCM01100.1 predicted protein [Fibroporia radiculosa]
MTVELHGVFTITNIQHGNRVMLPNNNHEEQVNCVIPVTEIADVETWKFEPSTLGRHQIRNVKHDCILSAQHPYVPGTSVVTTERRNWWLLEKLKDEEYGPDAYLIRHNDKRDLCWSLTDGNDDTPVYLQQSSAHRHSAWRIVRHLLQSESKKDKHDGSQDEKAVESTSPQTSSTERQESAQNDSSKDEPKDDSFSQKAHSESTKTHVEDDDDSHQDATKADVHRSYSKTKHNKSRTLTRAPSGDRLPHESFSLRDLRAAPQSHTDGGLDDGASRRPLSRGARVEIPRDHNLAVRHPTVDHTLEAVTSPISPRTHAELQALLKNGEGHPINARDNHGFPETARPIAHTHAELKALRESRGVAPIDTRGKDNNGAGRSDTLNIPQPQKGRRSFGNRGRPNVSPSNSSRSMSPATPPQLPSMQPAIFSFGSAFTSEDDAAEWSSPCDADYFPAKDPKDNLEDIDFSRLGMAYDRPSSPPVYRSLSPAEREPSPINTFTFKTDPKGETWCEERTERVVQNGWGGGRQSPALFGDSAPHMGFFMRQQVPVNTIRHDTWFH